jgi:hypothetical protein
MNKKQTNQPATLQAERSLTQESFRPYTAAETIHHHNHFNTAHLHKPQECDRFNSGLDRNRQSRFYFTSKKTSVRCYLNYDEKLVPVESENDTNFQEKKPKDSKNFKASAAPARLVKQSHQKEDKNNKEKPWVDDKNAPAALSGRKLSPRTLKNKFNISPKLIDDAKELVYAHESLSFVPVGYQAFIQPLPKAVTYADLAVIPIVPVVKISKKNSHDASEFDTEETHSQIMANLNKDNGHVREKEIKEHQKEKKRPKEKLGSETLKE